MRLIDADELKTKAIKCETFKLTDTPVFFKAVGTKEIDKAPTVDAFEVVRHKVTTRPLTDEEVAYYAEMEMDGIEYVFDCEMPDDGQEILIATKWGTDKDVCSNDAEYGIGLEGRGDWDGVYAWAEMPKYEVSE